MDADDTIVTEANAAVEDADTEATEVDKEALEWAATVVDTERGATKDMEGVV